MAKEDTYVQLPGNKHPIFDPEYFCSAKDVAYRDNIEALYEIRLWGVELFRRIYKQIDKNAHELMIVSVLFKQALVVFDAAIICLDNCAINASLQHARSLLETRLYLAWVFHKGNDRQYLGRQIYVSTKRHEMRMLKRNIPGTNDYVLYKEAWNNSGRMFSEPEQKLIDRSILEVEIIETLLNSDIYSEINMSFEKHSKYQEVPWYVPGKYGVKNIFKLAKELGRLPEFLNIYYTTSLFTHGAVSFVHSRFLGKGKHQIEPIRNIENFQNVFTLITNDMLFILDMMVREYREGERSSFKEKYQSWKPRLENFPDLKFNVKENLL